MLPSFLCNCGVNAFLCTCQFHNLHKAYFGKVRQQVVNLSQPKEFMQQYEVVVITQGEIRQQPDASSLDGRLLAG